MRLLSAFTKYLQYSSNGKLLDQLSHVRETSKKLRGAYQIFCKLHLNKSLQNEYNTMDAEITTLSKKSKKSQKKPEREIHIERIKKTEENFKPNASPSKGKLRAVVDLQMMKRELNQLEDPPITPPS